MAIGKMKVRNLEAGIEQHLHKVVAPSEAAVSGDESHRHQDGKGGEALNVGESSCLQRIRQIVYSIP